MKKILVILLCCPIFVFGQLGNYYKSNGHIKAKGLNFQIKIPLGFEQKEADRPNIVQKWTKGNASFMVMVKNLDQEIKNTSKNDLKDYLKNGSGLTDFTSGLSNISNLKYYVLDSYPGIYYELWMDMDRNDMSIRVYMAQASVFLEEHLFVFQLGGSKEDLREYAKLFFLMGNSVVFPDQYGN